MGSTNLICSIDCIFVGLHLSLSYVVHLSTSSGANKSIYAPEPFDVGRILQAEIVSNGQKLTVTTSGPIDPGWFWS